MGEIPVDTEYFILSPGFTGFISGNPASSS